MVDVKCGESECETTGFENRACFPIELPYNDPVFSQTNKSCLMFVRTQEVPRDDCKSGKNLTHPLAKISVSSA